MGTTPEELEGLHRPAGSTIDLAYVHSVATTTNVVHHTMGTRLLGVQRHGALIALAWRPHLADVDGGGLGHGPLTALLDHACALAALMSVDDPAKGGATMNLRVDHLAPTTTGAEIHVAGTCVGHTATVTYVQATAFHPDRPDAVLATGTATVARQP